MWRALQLVESSLSDVKASLPPGTLVRVERLTPASFRILSFNVSGHSDTRVLSELAQYTIRPALARVHRVGRVNVLGGDTREMEVVIDPDRAGGGASPPGRRRRPDPDRATAHRGGTLRPGSLARHGPRQRRGARRGRHSIHPGRGRRERESALSW
jgi:hypothetical protein